MEEPQVQNVKPIQGGSWMGITLNVLQMTVGVVSAFVFGKQAYDGFKAVTAEQLNQPQQ